MIFLQERWRRVMLAIICAVAAFRHLSRRYIIAYAAEVDEYAATSIKRCEQQNHGTTEFAWRSENSVKLKWKNLHPPMTICYGAVVAFKSRALRAA